MERIVQLIRNGFESSSGTTPEFKSFARKFKNDLNKELTKINATMTEFTRGHFYVSGFFRLKCGKCFYFSISDVRFFPDDQMLYRTAESETDYRGGRNQYITMETDMIYKMNL